MHAHYTSEQVTTRNLVVGLVDLKEPERVY
jgi:hypothetical protein